MFFNPHPVPGRSILPLIMAVKAKYISVSRVEMSLRKLFPAQYMRNMNCGIVIERAHTFLADMGLMLPAPAIEFLIFLRTMPPPEKCLLDRDAQVYLQAEAPVNKRLIAPAPCVIVALARVYPNLLHTTPGRTRKVVPACR